MPVIDMSEVRKLLDQADALAEELHGVEAEDPAFRDNRKDRAARLAEINRKLHYSAHLCDLAALEIRSQFHRFKGETPPTIHM